MTPALLAATVLATALLSSRSKELRVIEIDLGRSHVTARHTTAAKGEAKGIKDLHVVTCDIEDPWAFDKGAVLLENSERPAYVNSAAVGKDGTAYTLSRVTENRTRRDLISFPGPLRQ